MAPTTPESATNNTGRTDVLRNRPLKMCSSIDALPNASKLGTSQDLPSKTDHSQFWGMYLEEVEKQASERIEKYKNDMDIVVFFAALFSAVVATFLVAMQPLAPSPSDTTNKLLEILIREISNSTSYDQLPATPPLSHMAICSLVLGFASLAFSLLAALGAVLGKQWINQFSNVGTGMVEDLGRRRQQKMDDLKKWKFDAIMDFLPALLQLALALFAVSLCLTAWEQNKFVGFTLFASVGLGGLIYAILTISPFLFASCPFPTPLSTMVSMVIPPVKVRDPDPFLDFHAAVWILESSNHHDRILAAAVLVLDSRWPSSFRLSVPVQRLCDMFIDSVFEISAPHRRACAITLGKALVIMLSRNSENFQYGGRNRIRECLRATQHELGPELTFLFTLIIVLLPLDIGGAGATGDETWQSLRTERLPTLQTLPWEQICQRLLVAYDPSSPKYVPTPLEQRHCYLVSWKYFLQTCLDTQSRNINWTIIFRISERLHLLDAGDAGLLFDPLKQLFQTRQPSQNPESPVSLYAADAFHKWILSTVSKAAGTRADSPEHRMAEKALDMITIAPRRSEPTAPHGQELRLFNFLKDHSNLDERQRSYIVRAIGQCSIQELLPAFFEPPPSSQVQQTIREILRVACNRDELLKIVRIPIRPNGLCRSNHYMRLLDTILDGGFPDNPTLKEKWKKELAKEVMGHMDRLQHNIDDPTSLQRSIRIVCLLGEESARDRLSTKLGVTPRRVQEALKAASRGPVILDILRLCGSHQHPGYSNLAGALENVMINAWTVSEAYLSHHVSGLHPLAPITLQWLTSEQCPALSPEKAISLQGIVERLYQVVSAHPVTSSDLQSILSVLTRRIQHRGVDEDKMQDNGVIEERRENGDMEEGGEVSTSGDMDSGFFSGGE